MKSAQDRGVRILSMTSWLKLRVSSEESNDCARFNAPFERRFRSPGSEWIITRASESAVTSLVGTRIPQVESTNSGSDRKSVVMTPAARRNLSRRIPTHTRGGATTPCAARARAATPSDNPPPPTPRAARQKNCGRKLTRRAFAASQAASEIHSLAIFCATPASARWRRSPRSPPASAAPPSPP